MRIFLILLAVLSMNFKVRAQQKIPIIVENHLEGAPITMGLPFPIGELHSPDHVRVIDSSGNEIPSQITVVNTWEPINNSVKWIWVFFFTNSDVNYNVEYGESIQRSPYNGPIVTSINNQRSKGFAELETEKLRVVIDKGENGFLNKVFLDIDNDGFDEEDIIAFNEGDRGSFLDILDEGGLDQSKAIVQRIIKEKGSGPLHSILRIEGEYRYAREDNNASPFVTRIHAYAGKSYIKVLHSIVYTGEPDQHPGYDGEHANIATQNEKIIESYDETDSSWMKPNDRLAAAGFNLTYNLQLNKTCKTGYIDGKWWENGSSEVVNLMPHSDTQEVISVRQSRSEHQFVVTQYCIDHHRENRLV